MNFKGQTEETPAAKKEREKQWEQENEEDARNGFNVELVASETTVNYRPIPEPYQ